MQADHKGFCRRSWGRRRGKQAKQKPLFIFKTEVLAGAPGPETGRRRDHQLVGRAHLDVLDAETTVHVGRSLLDGQQLEVKTVVAEEAIESRSLRHGQWALGAGQHIEPQNTVSHEVGQGSAGQLALVSKGQDQGQAGPDFPCEGHSGVLGQSPQSAGRPKHRGDGLTCHSRYEALLSLIRFGSKGEGAEQMRKTCATRRSAQRKDLSAQKTSAWAVMHRQCQGRPQSLPIGRFQGSGQDLCPGRLQAYSSLLGLAGKRNKTTEIGEGADAAKVMMSAEGGPGGPMKEPKEDSFLKAGSVPAAQAGQVLMAEGPQQLSSYLPGQGNTAKAGFPIHLQRAHEHPFTVGAFSESWEAG